MHSRWFTSTFLSFFRFPQIKEDGPNFLGTNQFCRTVLIWSSLLYLNFKNLKDWNSCSFIRFDSILHGSPVLFSEFRNFLNLKKGGPNFLVEINSVEWLNYLVSSLLISILKNWRAKTLRDSSDFNAFYIITSTVLRFLKFPGKK